jgi:hypothetical protein
VTTRVAPVKLERLRTVQETCRMLWTAGEARRHARLADGPLHAHALLRVPETLDSRTMVIFVLPAVRISVQDAAVGALPSARRTPAERKRRARGLASFSRA